MDETKIISLWNELPFISFDDKSKIEEWKKYSLELLASLATGNTGLIADTGTGKTIMAFLAHEALNLRTLFVTPTVILTNQHADLYKNVTGKEVNVINGQKTKRDWKKGQLVIATPHVFMADFKKGLVNANLFDLLIVDELHKAEGQYPYVSIAGKFVAGNKEIICLSASPGSDYESIQRKERVYDIKHWVTADIEKPGTKHHLNKVELSPELKEAEDYFKVDYLKNLKMLMKVLADANQEINIPINENDPFLTQEQNDRLGKIVDALPKPVFYEAKFLFARQYKLLYLFRLLMTESYHSFLTQVEEVLAKDQSKSGRNIYTDLGFINMYWMIKKKIPSIHPKEAELLRLVAEKSSQHKSCLVFVSTKKLAVYLSSWFNDLGYKSDTLLGGKNKSLKHQLKVIEEFSRREITVIFATSVVEEGLSLPEIDVVVHYNQPMTEITRLQRGGRTGRFSEGSVYFLIMNIPYENALYYATLAKLNKMRAIFYKKPVHQDARPKRMGNKRKRVDLTNQLTINWFQEASLF